MDRCQTVLTAHVGIHLLALLHDVFIHVCIGKVFAFRQHVVDADELSNAASRAANVDRRRTP